VSACPDVDVLLKGPADRSIRAHLATCAACRSIVELAGGRSPIETCAADPDVFGQEAAADGDPCDFEIAIAALADGMLPAKDQPRVRKHLAGCSSCTSLHRMLIVGRDEIASIPPPGTKRRESKEKTMADVKVVKGVKIEKKEAAKLDKSKMGVMLTAPKTSDVEGQGLLDGGVMMCPWCGHIGWDQADGDYGWYTCGSCGMPFRKK
jgi:hypothetical protein